MFFTIFPLPLGRGNVAARSNFNRLGAFRKPEFKIPANQDYGALNNASLVQARNMRCPVNVDRSSGTDHG
jgi:hypothetical protein